MLKRIQRKRVKGWRMPPNTKCVTRPGPHGNPCRVGMFKGYSAADAVRDFKLWLRRDLKVRSYENAFGRPPTRQQIRITLGGSNVACYCGLCDRHKDGLPMGVKCDDCSPCHGDVLLVIANSKKRGKRETKRSSAAPRASRHDEGSHRPDHQPA